MKQKNKKILPPTIFYMLLLAGLFFFLLNPIKIIIIVYPITLFGIIPMVIGIILDVWADQSFKDYKTTVRPDEIPSTLITTGPFSMSRHPMYLGMMLILCGEAILLGSVVSFLIPILFLIFMELLFIPTEEKTLEQCFTEEYQTYKNQIRRWL